VLLNDFCRAINIFTHFHADARSMEYEMMKILLLLNFIKVDLSFKLIFTLFYFIFVILL
jgi:hypothetical protein